MEKERGQVSSQAEMNDLKRDYAAIRNYEIMRNLPMGTATLKQVKATPEGVEGFAKLHLQEDSNASVSCSPPSHSSI